MARNWGPSWSTNPYAPQIPYWLYFAEKANFAGFLIGAIFYGIVIVLFFQCLGAIFSTTNRQKGGTQWGLFAYVMMMFSFVTVYTAMNLNLQSVSYIDNREFPGNDDVPPGPLGYQWLIHASGLSLVPNLMFILNNWLADGLLIYRCFTIYPTNTSYSVIAFPCLAFLGSFATGLWFIYQTAQPNGVWNMLPAKIGLPYFSISTGLSVLLTTILLARFIPHARNIRTATGAQGRITGFYKAFLAILIESCGLYALNSLLFIIPWGIGSYVSSIFLPILAQTQAIAPFLIILRLANHTALTNEIILTGKGPIVPTKNQGKSIPNGTVLLAGGGVTSLDSRGRGPEHGVGFVATVDFPQTQSEKVGRLADEV